AAHHQLLAQNRDAQREIAQLVGHAYRLPEAAQVFPTGRAWADMREFGVFQGDISLIGAAKGCRQACGSRRHELPPRTRAVTRTAPAPPKGGALALLFLPSVSLRRADGHAPHPTGAAGR